MNNSFVKTYLIKDTATNLIKIGRSENPRERLVALQCGSGSKLKLIHVFDANIEKLLHCVFSKNRKHGEWFDLDFNDVISYVESINLHNYQVHKIEKLRRLTEVSKSAIAAINNTFEEIPLDFDDCGFQREWVEGINRHRDFGRPFYETNRFTNTNLRKEYNMVNMIVFGMPEESLRLILRVNDYDDLGPSLPKKHFDIMRQLQARNTVYIEDGIDFQIRKQKLTDLFNRKHKQKLIDEIHLLES